MAKKKEELVPVSEHLDYLAGIKKTFTKMKKVLNKPGTITPDIEKANALIGAGLDNIINEISRQEKQYKTRKK